jgi:hypothetical protein
MREKIKYLAAIKKNYNEKVNFFVYAALMDYNKSFCSGFGLKSVEIELFWGIVLWKQLENLPITSGTIQFPLEFIKML